MSIERRKILRAFGARLVLTDGNKGMPGAVAEAEKIRNSDPKRYVLLQQFTNPANPEIHERTTGPEIWDSTEGEVDFLIAGVGTGGTISGISRYFKHGKHRPLTSVAVEPASSPVITQHLQGQTLRPQPHKIQGIGSGFIPDNLDLSVVDERLQRIMERGQLQVRQCVVERRHSSLAEALRQRRPAPPGRQLPELVEDAAGVGVEPAAQGR